MATLDQSFTTTDNANVLRYSASFMQQAQQFTPSVTADIVTVELPLYKQNAPSGNVWVEIWSDGGGDTLGTQIGSDSTTVACSSISDTTYPGTYISFTLSGITLTSGTKYWIVFDGDYTVSTTDWIAHDFNTTGGYTGGIYARYAAGWAYDASADWCFKEYYQVATTGAKSGTIRLVGVGKV
jgi:hypothetical protein